jgi:hypothetical protein
MCNWKIRCMATFMLWAATNQGAYACDQRLIEPFTLRQSNGPVVEVNLFSQVGFSVGGNARYFSGRIISGPIHNGTLSGNHLHFLVPWDDGNVGIYDADIDNSGRLTNGRTFNRDRPGQNATWKADVTMQCCVTHPNPGCASRRACGDFCVGG